MTNNIVGLQEIADLLEVNKRTPHAWQYRQLLPPPDYDSINGLKAWNRSTIVDWAAKTGRLPAHLRSEATVEVTIPRGGRHVKAENIAALEAAGLIAKPDPSFVKQPAVTPAADDTSVTTAPRHEW